MWYTTLKKRLEHCGWILTDETHGNLVPNYYKYVDRAGENDIEICAYNTKTGKPGRVYKVFKNGEQVTM